VQIGNEPVVEGVPDLSAAAERIRLAGEFWHRRPEFRVDGPPQPPEIAMELFVVAEKRPTELSLSGIRRDRLQGQ
jgi:hypothetical protein